MIVRKTYTIIFYFIIILIVYGCNNNDEGILVYNANNKRIELLLLNNNKYIRYDEIVPVKFLIKGVKLNQLRILGPGISVSAENDSILRGTILVKKEFIKGFPNSIRKDTFYIEIFIVNNDNIKNRGEILVPLKM